MPDKRLDSLPAYNRVSIRAVLVHGDEDPGPALAAAGITNPIAIPVVAGEDVDLAGGILGDGITPNLIGLLETEQSDDFGAAACNEPDRSAPRPDVARPAALRPTTVPDAFGMRSFALFGRVGDGRSGRFGNGGTGSPPSPGASLEIDRMLAARRKKPRPNTKPGPYLRRFSIVPLSSGDPAGDVGGGETRTAPFDLTDGAGMSKTT